MVKLVMALLRMVGADHLRRIGSGLALFVIGGLVLGVAAVFGAVCAYQALLLRLEPWAAAGVICGVFAVAGVAVCWIGSRRLRGRARKRKVRIAVPALEAVAPALGLNKRLKVSPLQLVTIAAIVGFALGRGR
jgi:ABC-type Co2+ transport system permease subunit